MWTVESRPRCDRDRLHYPSDLLDDGWALIEPPIPPAKRGGRRRSVDVRPVVDGLLHILGTGSQWRYVPRNLPPRSTLFDHFDLSTYRGVIDRTHRARYVKCRERVEREASPTACITDGQSVLACSPHARG